MKKPIAVVYTDTHLEKRTIQTNYSITDQIISLCKDLKVKDIFHLGDIFDSRKAQPQDHLVVFYNILDKFENNKIRVHAIPGNHDKTDYENQDSFLTAFKRHPNFNLIEKFNFVELENIVFWMLPYFKEHLYVELLRDLIKEKKKFVDNTNKLRDSFLLTHIGVNGVANNKRNIVKNNIEKNLFESFNKVLVGHYHNSSQVGDNIYYIGSAFQRRYDEDSNKGCTIVYNDGSIEFKKLEFRKYKKVQVDMNITKNAELNELLKEYEESEDNIRFELLGPDSKLKSVDRNKFKKQGIDVKLKSNNIQQGIEAAKSNEFVSFDESLIIERFQKFCKEKNIKDKKYG